MPKVIPCLWFDNEAEEAAKFYTSIFNNSKIVDVSYYGEAGPQPAGTVLIVEFELDGQQFTALNGGPADFKPNESISFEVRCESQEEVDRFWAALSSEGGEESVCGWLKDKYGVSWQIIPNALIELMNDPDAEKAKRVTEAMLQMRKIDIAALQAAYGS